MNDDIRDFCPRCFATDIDGSWSHTVQGGYCSNCGAIPSVTLPEWAVQSIREQASWVGKRYYPNDEDVQRGKEIKELRSRMTEFPCRTVEPTDSGHFRVVQRLNETTTYCIYVTADTQEEAWSKAKTLLPFVPAEES